MNSLITQTVLGSQVFNSNDFDRRIRDKSARKAATITWKGEGDFAFKVANMDWKAAEGGVTKCDAQTTKNQAYFIPAYGEPCMSFPKNPRISGVTQTAPAAAGFAGYSLKWTADRCPFAHDAAQGLTVTINVVCDQAAADERKKKLAGKGATEPAAPFAWGDTEFKNYAHCDMVANYKGWEGCALVDLSVVLGPLRKASGFLEIALGLFLVFTGAYFVKLAFGSLVFAVVSGLSFLLLFNCGLIGGLNEGKIGTLVIVACLCCVAGGIVAWFTAQLADDYFVQIALACAGGALVGVVTAPLAIPGIVKTLLIVVTAGLCFYFGDTVESYIEYGATAFIGAVLLFHGIGGFVGGFPALGATSMDKLNPLFFGYCGGIIVFACLGTWVQMKFGFEHKKGEGYKAVDGEDAVGEDAQTSPRAD